MVGYTTPNVLRQSLSADPQVVHRLSTRPLEPKDSPQPKTFSSILHPPPARMTRFLCGNSSSYVWQFMAFTRSPTPHNDLHHAIDQHHQPQHQHQQISSRVFRHFVVFPTLFHHFTQVSGKERDERTFLKTVVVLNERHNEILHFFRCQD